MKWHKRRYQNSDGTLTKEGKKRYRKNRFIQGAIYGAIGLGGTALALKSYKNLKQNGDLKRTKDINKIIEIGTMSGKTNKQIEQDVQRYMKKNN